MLTSLFTDNDESNGPNDTKRINYIDNNHNNNNNIYNENIINNQNQIMRKNIYPKKRKLNINNDNNENLYNDYNKNSNYKYYNNKSEPNYNQQNLSNNSKNQYQSNLNNINQNLFSNNQEDLKYSKKNNITKYSNISNKYNNINQMNNSNKNNIIINNQINNKYEKNNNEHIGINSNQYNQIYNDNTNYKPTKSINNNNNEFPKINYEIKDYKAENLSKNEYYINYVTLNRQGYEYIKENNYSSALLIFQKCYDISKNYLKDNLKQINSLINISICQYYSGNFSESYSTISKAKKFYDSLYIQNSNISSSQKLQLTIKLFLNSSLANLSVNNYTEAKNDVLFLIIFIRKEKDLEKQLIYFRSILYTLFKIDSLLNYDQEENKNIFNNKEEDIDSNKIINNMMKGFIHCLKENDEGILLDTFKEAAQKYKKLNDGNGYYFSLFYHYLVLYDLNKSNFNENDIEEIKKKICLCNNKLIGNDLENQIKDKDINKLLNEFVEKIKCACDIYQTLENFEKELNSKIEGLNKEKSNNNISDDENNISYSHILDKSHLLTNDKINSPIFVKLLLRFSLNFLENQKKKLGENNNEINNQNNMLENYNALIEEIKIMNKKIESNEINIENIQLHQLDKEMINSLKQLFDNLIYIRYKCVLYQSFKKYRSKVRKKKNAKIVKKILNFLAEHYNYLIKGMNLIKINFKSNGFKTHFYDIDEDKLTFNIRKDETNDYPSKSYHIQNDIIKIQYGIKSRNLRKKLLSKEKDLEMLRLLRCPWRFLSIITRERSIDFYCDDEQINDIFYGMKYFLTDNNVPFKINSVNYYLLNKTKIKIAIELKKKYQEEDEENVPNIVQELLREKAIQNISFAKLILLYNKFTNNKL